MIKVSGDSLVLFECQLSHNLTRQLEKIDGKGSNTINEFLAKKKYFSQNPSKIVSKSYSAPSSSSLCANGDKYQISQGSYSSSTYVRASSNSPNDDQSLQLAYLYPHPSHATPLQSGPNPGFPNLGSSGYMVTDNQHVNSNMHQHVSQQYDEQKAYQLNFCSGYSSQYYPGNQSINSPGLAGPRYLSGPGTVAGSLPMSSGMPMSRYSNVFSYRQPQLRQQMPYVSYSMNPVSYVPIAYNEPIAYNDQYEQLQYQELNTQQVHPSLLSSPYMSSSPSNHMEQFIPNQMVRQIPQIKFQTSPIATVLTTVENSTAKVDRLE
jgi:hypothetical protein